MALDGRELLSTIVVNNPTDTPVANQIDLRQAITQANSDGGGDTIVFSSLFNTPQTITLTGGQLELSGTTAPTTITGPGANLLSVSGNNASRVFLVDADVTATISGLTITGGGDAYVGGGGGLYNKGTLDLTDCTVTGNFSGRSASGGGVMNTSTATLTNCTLSFNGASTGGGGLENFSGTATATLTDCTVIGNSASAGGGLYNHGGKLYLTDTTISRNFAQTGGGGGLDTVSGLTILTGVTVTRNVALGGSGGGLLDDDGSLLLTNTTVTGNGSNSVGGGLYLSSGELSLTNATVTGNDSNLFSGDGLYIDSRSYANITNTIVAGNGDDDIGGEGSYTGTNNLINVNPLLAPLGNYGGPTQTMPPLPGSPAIGAGTPYDAPLTDQRGQPRGFRDDIGACQVSLVVESSSGSDDTSAATLSLPGAVSLADQYGWSEISFDPNVFAAQTTITLASGQLELSNTSGTDTITGPGANLLSVSGNQASRVFQVDANVTASITGLTISEGHAPVGGGLYNDGGNLSLTDCTITGNLGANSGGGVATSGAATTNLTDSTVSGNRANVGGGVACLNGGRATLSGVTVTANYAGSAGGGLYDTGTASLTLTNCTISSNTASGTGGGLENLGGTQTATPSLSLTNCTVTGNSANQSGGGLFNVGRTTALTNCSVADNSANGYGGGLFNSGATLTLTSCTVSGNRGGDEGGGLYNQSATLTLTNCTVSGNTTGRGGGLFSEGGTATLASCSLSGNVAGSGGGLASFFRGAVSLTNCTVSGNSANSYGGGLYIFGPGTVVLTNCTVSGNSAPTYEGGGLYNQGGTFALTNTIVAGNPAGGDVVGPISGSDNLIGGNPLLAPLGDYGGPTQTMPLLPGSPAIGAGATVGAPATDQRGEPRAGHVDLGAFQSQGFTLTPVAGSTPQSALLGTAFEKPLAVTVTANNPVEPVNGGVVSFAVTPADGASAALSAPSAVIANGQDSATATANATPGTYTATATAAGATSIGFNLTNHAALGAVRPGPGDVVLEFDDLTSLRAAIAYANSHPGPDTILFDPALFGAKHCTIRLVGGPLVLTDPATTTIIGPGAGSLTIQGDGKTRVFDIEGGSLALSGVTITGGNAGKGSGGGIRNHGGTLWLEHVVLRGNRARVGGGLFNDGTTTLTDVVLRGNTARLGSGMFSTREAALTWWRSPARGVEMLGFPSNPRTTRHELHQVEVRAQATTWDHRRENPAAPADGHGAGGPRAIIHNRREQPHRHPRR
jgi:parallel beta-helix repeat protein